jgi:hypothetical protein
VFVVVPVRRPNPPSGEATSDELPPELAHGSRILSVDDAEVVSRAIGADDDRFERDDLARVRGSFHRWFSFWLTD